MKRIKPTYYIKNDRTVLQSLVLLVLFMACMFSGIFVVMFLIDKIFM